MDPIDYALARAVLGIEAQRWTYEAAKLAHIKTVTGLSATQYALLLVQLVTTPDPDLAAEFPTVFRRVRARMDAKLRLVSSRNVA
jgi:hypothetical protein